ncbi:MAG TPA: glycosyltransferase [Dermatophilaceae bacterium]|nr:glycosyltransferase [Dermatophilaceae bacterium]
MPLAPGSANSEARRGLVACVVVTYRRPTPLQRCLSMIQEQDRRPDLLIVVDNDNDAAVEALVAASPLVTRYLPARRNLGGAGGYAYGIAAALAAGADWVWLADDDGRPGDQWTLSRLLSCAVEQDLDLVSPLVLDESDPARLAFPLRRGLRWATYRHELEGVSLVPNVANLFNGTLIAASAVHSVGLPDLRLFVRGDEVDLHRRLRLSGRPFGTCVGATYLHPQGREDWRPLFGGRLSVLVPSDPSREETTYRNLGYLTSQRGLRWRRLPDAARYAWWFLAHERDLPGAVRWWRLASQGRRQRFPDRPAGTTAAQRRAAADPAPPEDLAAPPLGRHVPLSRG